jgi:hypothetical protein
METVVIAICKKGYFLRAAYTFERYEIRTSRDKCKNLDSASKICHYSVWDNSKQLNGRRLISYHVKDLKFITKQIGPMLIIGISSIVTYVVSSRKLYLIIFIFKA